MPSIASLPNELVAFVLENLKYQRDIAALCQTNRKLYEAVSPVLYKNAVDHCDMWPLAFAAFSGRAGTMRKMLAAGADPNWAFNEENIPPQAWLLIVPDNNRMPLPRSTPFGRSRPSRQYVDFRQTEPFSPPEPWSARSSDYDDDDLEEDEHLAGDDLDVWGTWTGVPLDPGGSATGSELDGPDGDASEHPTTTDDSGADSSTLGYSDRQRDVAFRGHACHDSEFFSPLHIAAGMGHNEVVEVLLDHGAAIDAGSRLCGCKRAAGMLNHFESPETDAHLPQWTPLHVAICYNRPDTAMLLLSRGAKCTMEHAYNLAVSEENSTALHYAAALGQVDLVKYLVEKGHQTDVNVQDRRTLTPLYYAYANGRWDSTVPLLVQMGADINVEIKFYQPYCTITPLGEAVRLGNFEDAQKLIDLGADPSHGFVATGAGHRKGLSPLHLGCMPSARRRSSDQFFDDAEKAVQRIKIMETFIAKGSDIHGTDCYGDTPLISAAQNRVLASVTALIAAGADVNARNSLGRTVIMQAVLGPPNPLPGSMDDRFTGMGDTLRVVSSMLAELVRAGARIDDVDNNGNNALHLFLEKSKLLAPQFVGDVMRFLLSYPGADALVTARNKEGQLPFEMAFYSEAIEACEVLLRRGLVQRSLFTEDLQRMLRFTIEQPKHISAHSLDMLLDLDFDRELWSNASLLREAAVHRAWNVLGAISRRGLPPLDRDTCTQLFVDALNFSEWDLAYKLVERGADVNAVVKNRSDTPLALHVVIDRLHTMNYNSAEKLVEILIDKGADIHYSQCGAPHARPLNQAIDTRYSSLVRVMLKDRPLRDDPRAVGGCYLHHALSHVPTENPETGYKHQFDPRIVYDLLQSGADRKERDKNGDYPLAVLLRRLCDLAAVTRAQDFQFNTYSDLLKELCDPALNISLPNKDGFSVVDYLDDFLETKAVQLWATPSLELVKDANGAEVIRIIPDMRLKRTPVGRPVTNIWEGSGFSRLEFE